MKMYKLTIEVESLDELKSYTQFHQYKGALLVIYNHFRGIEKHSDIDSMSIEDIRDVIRLAIEGEGLTIDDIIE